MSPDIILLVVAAALLVFMFWSSSRRRKKAQADEEKRQASLVPGTAVMTRSGLYGTLVEFDPEDLTKRAVVEIAPGVEVQVHAQTVVLDPDALVEPEEAEEIEEQIPGDDLIEDARTADELSGDDAAERRDDEDDKKN